MATKPSGKSTKHAGRAPKADSEVRRRAASSATRVSDRVRAASDSESARAESALDPKLLRRLLRAKDRMDVASHEEWPVHRLARVSRVSEAHFARSFKDAFGIPPHRYLLTRRIERAKTLLRDTELPTTDIAFQTGWKSLGTF